MGNLADYPLFRIGNTSVTAASLIVTLAILAGSYLLARLARTLIANRLLARTRLSPGVRYAFGRFAGYLVFFLGAAAALQTLGINATTLAAFGAAVGVGIGFGLQDLVKNFVAGLVILIERPFQVGDRIEIEHVSAQVWEIRSRATVLRTNDDVHLIVPNSKLTNETVILRTADHGELGLSHGLREKAYSAYEEMIHVPLCISCPAMYSAPQHTSAFWSHVDLMATVCGLAGVKAPPTAGINQVPVLMTPTVPLRDSVLFAFDDAFLLEPDLPGCNPHIRALRTTQYTYAVYFSTTPATPFEYELYDNLADPLQMNNLLFAKPAALMDLWTTLDAQLQAAMREANAAPPNVVWQAPQPAG